MQVCFRWGGASADPGTEKATCDAAYAECKKVVTITIKPRTCEKPKNCTATVAEIEACLNDQAKVQSGLIGNVPSCSTADFKTFDGEKLFEADDPASCAALEAKCPDGEELVNPDVDSAGLDEAF